jgi:1,4-alpha-glucan branching enzyme
MQKPKVGKRVSKTVTVAKSVVKPATKKAMFRFAAPLGCRVFVAGTFNGWSTDEHALAHNAKSGFFQTTLALAPGRYEYKFVVDGTWVADPACPDWVPNEHGSLNSVIVV